jgi:hypothetical protein
MKRNKKRRLEVVLTEGWQWQCRLHPILAWSWCLQSPGWTIGTGGGKGKVGGARAVRIQEETGVGEGGGGRSGRACPKEEEEGPPWRGSMRQGPLTHGP